MHSEIHLNIREAIKLVFGHFKKGLLAEAGDLCARVLRARPDNFEALNLSGVVAAQRGKNEEAMHFFSRAAAVMPCNAEPHNNMGKPLRDQGKLIRAMNSFSRALELKPDLAEAYSNLGNVQKDLGLYAAAAASYRKALALKPGYADAFSNLLFSLHYDPEIDNNVLLQAHLDWAARYGTAISEPSGLTGLDADPTRKLRIGFVSTKFCRHPVGYMTLPVLEHLSRDSFEIVVYSDSRKADDDFTRRYRRCADQWVLSCGLSDAALAERMRADHIDILIDLAGHAEGCRLGVAARRAAPVQVKWVGGLFNTTGLPQMDYLIGDQRETPAGDERWYTESLLRMPHGYVCYEPADYAPEVNELPAMTNGRITFACFNNGAKINAKLAAIWARILDRVPDSRLLLKYKQFSDPEVCDMYRVRLADAGVPVERLEFLAHSPHRELLATYNRVDIGLDTWPYSGGLTTCEALWMGVPVVTLPGHTFAGRHSCSHLYTVGLRDWIARSADEYVEIAVRWAQDLTALAKLRSGLRQQVRSSPLCDYGGFAHELGKALRQVWATWCQKQQSGQPGDNRLDPPGVIA